MDNLIHIVGEELDDWTDETADPKRYSIFTQNMMLAHKVSKRQHLTPRSSKITDGDDISFHTAGSVTPVTDSSDKHDVPEDNVMRNDTLHVSPTPANIGRARSSTRRASRSRRSSSGDWSWRPSIPHRTSSMTTRCKKGGSHARPDLATFHRRSCQLFSSLDSTLSSATAATARTGSSMTSTSTSPSLASSVTTQATSILDDSFYTGPAFPSFHIELNNPTVPVAPEPEATPDFGDFLINHTPRIGVQRSSSQLSPQITSTEQVFWTTDQNRQAEYAKIDAAHTGFKGFMKRILPRKWGWAHGKRRNFYQQAAATATATEFVKQCSDRDSVRRYRISVASATEEAIKSAETFGVCSPQRLSTIAGSTVEEVPIVLETSASQAKKITKTGPVDKVLAKFPSSDALSKMFKSNTKIEKNERRAKTLSREMGY